MKILVQTVAAGALIAIAFVVPTLSAYATKSDNDQCRMGRICKSWLERLEAICRGHAGWD